MIILKTTKYYCEDYTKIENYDEAQNDKTQTWVLHHRLETHFSNGDKRPENSFLSRDELKALDMYNNRPPEELIFMTKSEHMSLHMKNVKKKDDTKRKISKANTGYKQSDERIQKHIEAMKGRHWYNNGTISINAFECPEGFVPGRLGKFRAWNKGKACNTPHDPKTGRFVKKNK